MDDEAIYNPLIYIRGEIASPAKGRVAITVFGVFRQVPELGAGLSAPPASFCAKALPGKINLA